MLVLFRIETNPALCQSHASLGTEFLSIIRFVPFGFDNEVGLNQSLYFVFSVFSNYK